MAYRAKKTEHSGPKQGRGAYWGRKAEAKRHSGRKRRADDKGLIQEEARLLNNTKVPTGHLTNEG